MERALDAVPRRCSRTSRTVAPPARSRKPSATTVACSGCGSRRPSSSRRYPGGTFGYGGTPRSTARRFASTVRSAVTRRWYSDTAPSSVPESHVPALPFVICRTSTARIAPPAASTRPTTSAWTARDRTRRSKYATTTTSASPLRRVRRRGAGRDGSRAARHRRRSAPPAHRRRRGRRARRPSRIRSRLLGRTDQPLAVAVADTGDADDADGSTHRGGTGDRGRDGGAGLHVARGRRLDGDALGPQGGSSRTVFLPQGRHPGLYAPGLQPPGRLRRGSRRRARWSSG